MIPELLTRESRGESWSCRDLGERVFSPHRSGDTFRLISDYHHLRRRRERDVWFVDVQRAALFSQLRPPVRERAAPADGSDGAICPPGAGQQGDRKTTRRQEDNKETGRQQGDRKTTRRQEDNQETGRQQGDRKTTRRQEDNKETGCGDAANHRSSVK
ncbi:unnamed protein product [Pleuronectes platessa]|uniref:Uncharacterized protein n=1 Tax=Pleuronectes platessa TaxID=8262 RepID=A0A9N7YCW0_PLEPL|nr:unnamed protein product [Pleuronectes platessa]